MFLTLAIGWGGVGWGQGGVVLFGSCSADIHTLLIATLLASWHRTFTDPHYADATLIAS